MKKNVYFIQVNYLYGKTAYLPYAVGSIAAYAWQDPLVREEYACARFFFVRQRLEQLLEEMQNPAVVAFSSYIWNFEYNKALARAVRARYPNCVTVFGGHQIPFDSCALLEECPEIDFLIHEEGEQAFTDLLKALAQGGSVAEIANLSYRDAQGVSKKNPNAQMVRYDYPSPYLNGLFEDLFTQADYEFSATLETNRGCPFHCAFCDWGTLRGKLRKFPMERVKAEIEWMAAHQIDHVYCADANFGIFPRDDEIVDLLIESKKKTGFPRKFRVCYTKNSDETVFALNQKLDVNGMSKGATLSFQSVCPEVLRHIGRENLTMERFRDLMALYNQAAIPSNSELILALPGETYASFCEGVGKLLEAGQHSSLNIYNCELLPNAKMADPAYQKEHGIRTVTTLLGRNHCDSTEEEEVAELSEIVCETASMPRADWVRANLFALAVQSFHCLGPLQCISIYLFYEKKLAFADFYERLLRWMKENPATMAGALMAEMEQRFLNILEGNGSWSYVNPMFGNIIWPFEEGVFLEVMLHFDRFYAEIKPFLEQLIPDASLLSDLLGYQQAILKLPKKQNMQYRFLYDWQRYFSGIFRHERQALAQLPNVVTIQDTQPVDTWEDYAREIVWYGRKGSKNLYTKMDVEYE